MHNFIVSDTGKWTVVQQGMHTGDQTARRYHWHSDNLSSFTEAPHTGTCGINQGPIFNLTAAEATGAKAGILRLTIENPATQLKEIQKIFYLRTTMCVPKTLTLKDWAPHFG